MARFVRAAGVVARRIAGELVLIPTAPPTDGPVANFYVLNESGEVLWSRLEQPASTDDLAAELVREYGLGQADARADAEQFLADLRNCGGVQAI